MKSIIKRIIVAVSVALILSFINSCEVKAATAETLYFAGKTAGDQFFVTARGYVQGTNDFYLGNAYNYTVPNYLFIDICSNGGEPDFRVQTSIGKLIHNNKSYQLTQDKCDITINGTTYRNVPIYRQIMLISSYINATHPVTGITMPYIEYTGRIWTNADYNTAMKIYRTGTSYDIPMDEITLDNDLRKLQIMQDIKTILENNNGNQTLINSINNQTQKIVEGNETNEEIRDFLKDNSLPSGNSDIDNMQNKVSNNGTISSLVTMPITFMQKIINGLNGSCTPIVIGELFDYNFTMPCIRPQDYIGIIWNIIDVICAGFLVYHLGKRMVNIFHKVSSLKDGGLEEAYD